MNIILRDPNHNSYLHTVMQTAQFIVPKNPWVTLGQSVPYTQSDLPGTHFLAALVNVKDYTVANSRSRGIAGDRRL